MLSAGNIFRTSRERIEDKVTRPKGNVIDISDSLGWLVSFWSVKVQVEGAVAVDHLLRAPAALYQERALRAALGVEQAFAEDAGEPFREGLYRHSSAPGNMPR